MRTTVIVIAPPRFNQILAMRASRGNGASMQAQSLLPARAQPHLQALETIESMDTLLVVRPALAAHHDPDADVTGNATYSFVVRADASDGEHAGLLHVYVEGVQLARVSFLNTAGSVEAAVQDVAVNQRVVNSAFASYAAEDRNEVLALIQGLQRVATHLDVFLDVVALRSGERWAGR
jgi:hypothetical protein